MGPSQKLTRALPRDISQGQALSNWVKYSKKTREDRRGEGTEETDSHLLGGTWISAVGTSGSVLMISHY